MLDWYYRKKWGPLKELKSGRQVWTCSRVPERRQKTFATVEIGKQKQKEMGGITFNSQLKRATFSAPCVFSVCAESENAERSNKIRDNQKIFDVVS